MTPEIYLFDLDGTLVDSAPDLAAAANHLRIQRDLPPLPYDTLKVTASSGARGLLKAAFNIEPSDPGYNELAKEFLDYYGKHLSDNSFLFPGIKEVLSWLAEENIPWGIVTNKNSCFTFDLIKALDMHPGVVVCGDTLPERKPSPMPLLYAAQQLNRDITKGIYCGDDLRDIQSANAAHTYSIAVAWGYMGNSVPVSEWQADLVMHNPSELIDFQIP